MFARLFDFSRYRPLRRGEDSRLLRHLLRLSERDLYHRFLVPMSVGDLRAHLARGRREAIGWFNRGTLRGAAELLYTGQAGAAAVTVEAGVTVEPEFRGRGVGRGLILEAMRRARRRGHRFLGLLGHREDQHLLTIAAECGAVETSAHGHMIEGLAEIDDPLAVLFVFDLDGAAGQGRPGFFARLFGG